VPSGQGGQHRSWRRKFTDAFRGLSRGIRGQSSFAVHLPAAVAVVAAALMLGVPRRDLALLALAVGGVLVAELVNSAIESLVRAPGVPRHPRIRDALDIASAAVLVAAGTAVVVGGLVFGPPLWRILDSLPAGR